MTPAQAGAIARLTPEWRKYLRLHYKLPSNQPVSYALQRAGVSYLDVVTHLARKRDSRRALACLTGKPVAVLPCTWVRWPKPVFVHPEDCASRRIWRDCRITYVDKDAPTKYAQLLRTRCTPRNLHACGVPWRDLLRALEAGWLRVAYPDEEPAPQNTARRVRVQGVRPGSAESATRTTTGTRRRGDETESVARH